MHSIFLMEVHIKWIYKSDIRSWGTWFCKNIIIIPTLKGLLFYSRGFCWRFQKILNFSQRQICISLHKKITFHFFYYFDNVLQDDGLPNCSLKHSSRKWMIYYWKLGKFQGTMIFHCTVKVTDKDQSSLFANKIIEDHQ